MVAWVFTELEETGSTQAVAKRLAAMGSPEGTAVVAKSQSSGQGRLGRNWASPVGGLYMSFVLRPRNLPKPELASLVSAVAISMGVEKATGLVSKIRWPNDVVVGRKKLAGTIAEAQFSNKELSSIIVGIGLNCNAPVRSVPESGGEATSLFEELGNEFEISEIRQSILDSFSGLYSRWQAGEDMVPVWKEHVGTPGKEVVVKMKTNETPFSFKAVGVDSEGGLILFRDGKTKTIRAQDLELLREEA